MTRPRRVAVVQDYVPAYRVKFFELLVDSLGRDGVQVDVIANSISAANLERGDSWSAPRDWLKRPAFSVMSKLPSFRSRHRSTEGVTLNDLCNYDAVVVGLLGSSYVSNWLAMMRLKRTDFRLVYWGHVGPYVSKGNALDLAVERVQMQIADAVLSYTRGGFRYAIAKGVLPAKVFTLNNTIEEWVEDEEMDRVGAMSCLGLDTDSGSSRFLCFVGGLDESKRISFLVEVLDRMWDLSNPTVLLVGGSGAQESLLDAATERGQVIRLGRVGEREKRALGLVASAVVCPGRVGLLAVDALRMRTPVITLASSMHAPEIEYLTERTSVFYSDSDDVESYVELVNEVLDSSDRLDIVDASPSLDDMVEAYSRGVIFALES